MNRPTSVARFRRSLLPLLCATALVTVVSAHAQPSPTPSATPSAKPTTTPSAAAPKPSAKDAHDDGEARKAKARARFLDGVAAGKKNDWPKAYDAFLEAWKLKEHPQIALNLGRAELETARYREAAEHLQYCIDKSNPADPDEAANITLAKDWLTDAKKKAAKLTITVDYPGVRLLVDDVLVGKEPLPAPVLVNPGSHTIEGRLGTERVQRGVVVTSAEEKTVRLHFQTTSVPLGTSSPTSAPTTPVAATTPSSSSSSSSIRPVVLLTGLGGTLAGLTVGIVAGVQSMRQEAIDEKCTRLRDPKGLECWTPREANRQALAWTSFGGFAAFGIFALATGALFFWGPKEDAVAAPAKVGVTITPWISPNAGALSVEARF